MTALLSSLGRTLFQLSYEISPVILTNGIAANLLGGLLPIVALTESIGLVNGLLTGDPETSLDQFLFHFRPMPGSTLIDFQIGQYPFANQTVAANAILAQPLKISYLVACPPRGQGGVLTKFATFMALQAALQQHSTSGGTYTCVTPTYIYLNCILTGFRDASSADSKHAQNQWQMDFEQPLVTLEAAQGAYSALMQQVANGTPMGTQPGWTGNTTAAGSPAGIPGGAPGPTGTTGSSVGGYVPVTTVPVTSQPL